MKSLKFIVTVEGRPDHAKEDSVQLAILNSSTEWLHDGYNDRMSVVVTARDNRPTFSLWFDRDDNRWQRDQYGLHCGDGLEVCIDGTWHETRIEHSSSSEHSRGWYLVDFPNQPLHGLTVRKQER